MTILTEWEEFKDAAWRKIGAHMLKLAFLFGGRNILNKEQIGVVYRGIGQ